VLKIHYVGSIKLSDLKSLAKISNKDSRFVTSESIGLESTKSCSTGKMQINIEYFQYITF
jgi:hypothetical protein